MTARRRSSGGVSAAELKAKLQNDPDYQRQAEAAEAERQLRVQELRQAARPVIDELRGAGYEVNSVWDLGNNSDPYPDALPILLKHLQRGGYPDPVMESLAQALAVKQSSVIWGTLRDLYLAAVGPGEEEGLAAALAASATADQVDALVDLLLHASTGVSTRIHFLRPIKEVGGKRGLEVLKALQDDERFGNEARALLKGRAG